MYLIGILVICILSYVSSFQESENNINLLENEHNIEAEPQKGDYLKVQFPNASNNIYTNTADVFNSDSSESAEDDDDILTDMLNKEEIQELREIVSSIEERAVYNGVYHPYEFGNNGPHRRRKRASEAFIDNLHNVVSNLDNMINDTVSKKDKKKYFDKAVVSLDKYIKEVQDSTKIAPKSTIQIMKINNVLIVQCAGWLWYPISKLNKTITCAEGVMRFESRERTLARACNLFNCLDLAL